MSSTESSNVISLHNARVNIQAKGSARVHVESEGGVLVRPKIVKKVEPRAEGAVSPNQLAQIKEKVEEWVSVSVLVGKAVTWGRAYSWVKRQAVSVSGVVELRNFPLADFDGVMKKLQSKIGELKRTNKYLENDPEAAFKSMTKAIKVKQRERGIADQQYRDYLISVYGVDSSTKLQLSQLKILYEYVLSGGRFLIPKEQEKSILDRRIESLARLMEARKGEIFTSRTEAFNELKRHEYGLFGDLTDASFDKFWKVQQVTKVKRGRPRE
jgi:hypothetical protein